MKARNPSTGTLDTVYVKALDGMPVGTEVEFDGTSANIPTGWEQADVWQTLATNVSNNTNVNLPDDFDELFVEINMIPSGGTSTNYCSCIIPKIVIDNLSSDYKHTYRSGASYVSNYYFGVSVEVYKTYLKFTDAYITGTDVSGSSKMNVYYK